MSGEVAFRVPVPIPGSVCGKLRLLSTPGWRLPTRAPTAQNACQETHAHKSQVCRGWGDTDGNMGCVTYVPKKRSF